jgi:hypothetical protein
MLIFRRLCRLFRRHFIDDFFLRLGHLRCLFIIDKWLFLFFHR